MAKPQFLTKSRFKVGSDCPTKLFYLDNKSFGNLNSDNSFLAALAEGGFQVGELAKLYFPNGTEILEVDKAKAATQTSELLKQENVTIYEASFLFENLFIKADVVKKTGSKIELIEVKAKSFDPTIDDQFYTKRSLKKGPKIISSEWQPYLLDVTFQSFVIQKCFPKFDLSCFLMLADKSKKASIDGLNQKFFLSKDENGHAKATTELGFDVSKAGNQILCKINVDEPVTILRNFVFENGKTFEAQVSYLSQVCKNQSFEKPNLSNNCKSCEFRIGEKQENEGLKNGFKNCWKSVLKKEADLNEPFVFDVWNFRKSKSLIEEGTYLMRDIKEEEVSPTSSDEGLSASERQWLQIQKHIDKSNKPFIDLKGLSDEMKNWIFPLHFIDFETTMVAIPFNKGRRPYEQMAFQFSHHTITKSGEIEHVDEYINRKRGLFPNFDFVRALKRSLSHDMGTIFRFATHENTVLCQIREQLLDSDEKDKKELIQFIETITTGESSDKTWTGSRNMVDMCELVKRYFYHPYTKGSNSIKKVLPAVLKESKYLQEKYSKPVYGSQNIQSKNYSEWTWIEMGTDGQPIDPYKRLPPVFSDISEAELESMVTENSLADGGAAMTAYSRMQFTQMSEKECDAVAKALLKYCELDTFAMVLIFEYWNHEIKNQLKKKKAA